MQFLQAAETNARFRAELPAFVAEVKTIFERWQLDEYLETEPFDPSRYVEEAQDAEFIERERKNNFRCVANELFLLERAKEWLLDDDTSQRSEGKPQ